MPAAQKVRMEEQGGRYQQPSCTAPEASKKSRHPPQAATTLNAKQQQHSSLSEQRNHQELEYIPAGSAMINQRSKPKLQQPALATFRHPRFTMDKMIFSS
ncbi:hypothetical protein Nepgr_027228 [Nepenthes gracilis]|uniref:Uncharacterized protein n=1 Tax=Nepenthes gracilis TaxID=150966 RepID=A0AAD3T890_NEPGR|nr:hypothetical protein Nepgr_027228 [Nepenthes gracilis]